MSPIVSFGITILILFILWLMFGVTPFHRTLTGWSRAIFFGGLFLIGFFLVYFTNWS